MLVILKRDSGEVDEQAAQILAGAIKKKPALTLGLATGGTMVGVYENLVCRIVNVFTNGSQWCMLASCLFHLRLNCPSRTQIASSYSRLAVIAAHPEELFSASTLSLARPREWPITFWHVTCLPLCQPYCYGGGDLTAAG